MKHIITTILILIFTSAFSQVSVFRGYINSDPVQMVMYPYPDGITRAIYAYDESDTPLIISGRLKLLTTSIHRKFKVD